MQYQELNTMLTGRNATRKKLANNTYAIRSKGSIAIRLHETDVLTFFPDGSVQATSGGWKTVTTKDRLNQYLPHGLAISQRNGIWYWFKRSGMMTATEVIFTDGDSINPDGTLNTQGRTEDITAAKTLRKQINDFARLCADKVPLPVPGAGDCLYCQGQVSEGEHKGKTLGDAFKNHSHLQLHMEEGYVVPSLVFRALKEHNAGDLILAATFGQSGTETFADISKGHVKRAVAKYMFKRFNSVS